jgi:UDP:flavonoid glycosyltransferase YjiC (YdhE family)
MRILFCSTAGWGHVHPMIPLAKAFVDAGEDVLWATSAEGCERLLREGFAAAPCGLDGPSAMSEFTRRFPEIGQLARQERPEFMFPRLFGAVRAGPMLSDVLPVAQRWSPTLVVSEAGDFAGHIIAARLGIPSVTHSFGSLIPQSRVAAAGEQVASLWAASGLDPSPYGGSYDHLYLDIYPPSLQPEARPHVPVTQPLRPSAFATAGDEQLPEWVAAKSEVPLVYVTLGTVFSNNAVLATVVEGLRDLDVRVVVTVGPRGDPAALGDQPTNIHVARYIPQDQILPHCSAVISHGGSGTFLAALAAGLPQLCLPQAADQFTNAANCARSGTGVALQPDSFSAANIRAAAERLLSDAALLDAARALSQEITAMPSPLAVAEQLRTAYA